METDFEKARIARRIEEQFWRKFKESLTMLDAIQLQIEKRLVEFEVKTIRAEDEFDRNIRYRFWDKNLKKILPYRKFDEIFPLSQTVVVLLTSGLFQKCEMRVKMFHDFPYLANLREKMEPVSEEELKAWLGNINSEHCKVVIGVSTSGWYLPYGIPGHPSSQYLLLFDLGKLEFVVSPGKMDKLREIIRTQARIDDALRTGFYGRPSPEPEKTAGEPVFPPQAFQQPVEPLPEPQPLPPVPEPPPPQKKAEPGPDSRLGELVEKGTTGEWKEYIRESLNSKTKISLPQIDPVRARIGYGYKNFFNLLFEDREIVELISCVFNSPDRKTQRLLGGDAAALRGLKVLCNLLMKKTLEFNLGVETEWEYFELLLNDLGYEHTGNTWKISVSSQIVMITKEEKKERVRYILS
ncbi:MAG: hypothetical protein QW115_02940 [Thermoplasmata archaeon]